MTVRVSTARHGAVLRKPLLPKCVRYKLTILYHSYEEGVAVGTLGVIWTPQNITKKPPLTYFAICFHLWSQVSRDGWNYLNVS